jgi:DNA-binding PadR family transcriptional regulator
MPIQHAVLALLRDGPSHGYELKGAFEAAIGPQWGTLNIGHLYQVLERLSRNGLVRSSRVAQDIKPDRVVYEMTPDGERELADWMSTPAPRTAGFRDDFFLKMMAAARSADPDLVASVVDVQRTHLLHELRNLESLRHDPDREPMIRLLLSAAARHVTADLGFLDDVEAELLRRPASSASSAAVATAPLTDGAAETRRWTA